jgi:sugar/nucleoside kinase (ribokinase family)
VSEAVRIVTLGDVVLDVLVAGSDLGSVAASRDAAGGVRLCPGGSAANFAVAAAAAGAHVTFFGCVGDDVAGRLLVAELERAGVTARVRRSSDAATGSILVIVGEDGPGSSRMISDPGASRLLGPEDLDARELAAADLVHVTGYSWLREGPAAAARAAVRYAREAGRLLTFDPGPAHLIEAYGGPRLAHDIATEGFDVLFPNLEEGARLTSEEEPGAILRSLRLLAPVVALTMGADGCLVAWDPARTGAQAGLEGGPVHVPAVAAEVRDTTGAGDAFAAGFAEAFARARDPIAAARAGARAAAVAVARLGSR